MLFEFIYTIKFLPKVFSINFYQPYLINFFLLALRDSQKIWCYVLEIDFFINMIIILEEFRHLWNLKPNQPTE